MSAFDGNEVLLACLKLVLPQRRGGDLEFECRSYESTEHFCEVPGRLVGCPSYRLWQAIKKSAVRSRPVGEV